MDMKAYPLRHPRVVSETRLRHEGGDPRHYRQAIGSVSWVPASAGMTIALALVVVLFGASNALAHTGLEHATSFSSGFRRATGMSPTEFRRALM